MEQGLWGLSVSSRQILSMICTSESGRSETALGHVRLAIVGGTYGGQQPFRSCDGRFTLEHNGEIYNYKKLKDRLSREHKFTTETDSEVIVHLLEEYFSKTVDLYLMNQPSLQNT